MKKVLKISGIVILLLVIFLIVAPFLFQDKIKAMVKNFANDNINATVDFKDVSLSFLLSFPKANLTIDELTITNFAPFEGDKLVDVKSIALDFSITELFKDSSDGPIEVKSIYIDNALVNLKTNKAGAINWDIAKASTGPKAVEAEKPKTEGGFAFKLDDYAITNSNFNYLDEKVETYFSLSDLNHSGQGTFSQAVSELATKTDSKVSLKIGESSYLENNSISLDATLGLDLENSKYTFKENKAIINQLPIAFSGYFQQLEKSQKMDLEFHNTGASFKDFLALVPKGYSKDLAQVNTTGNFSLKGLVKGELSETKIPTLDINLISKNASFKYNDLPKTVKNINLNAVVKNTTGLVDDTYVDLKTLNFKIDEDVFKSSAKISNLTKNMAVNANVDGVLNLANITKAYPIELENELTGILKAKLNTSFDMNAIETNAYQRIKNNGNVTVEGFKFSSKDIVNPINISKANVGFKPGVISLDEFKATTGKSDLNATGRIDNLLGFLLSDKKLKGTFNVNSNTFGVSDFMVEASEEDTTSSETNESETNTAKESLKIPAFLDATINADAKTVYYDNLTLKDVKGQLVIKDEKAQLKNVKSNIFGGDLSMDGLVDTTAEVPNFNMNLNAHDFNISQSFKDLDLLKSLAPLVKLFEGKLNSKIALSGKLDGDFAPNLSTITVNALAELLTTEFKPQNEKVMSLLQNKLSFLDFSKLNAKDIIAKIAFNNGKVEIQPFDLAYDDIAIKVGGSHNLENKLDYKAVLQVPAKYLGSDVTALINKIDDPEVNKITIPVTANITGDLLKPAVKTDLSSGVKSLTSQLIEIQKQKLIGQGKDKIKDLLGDVLGGNSNNNENNDSNSNTGGVIKDVLGDVLGGNSNDTKDSTKTESNPVKNVFGSIFGRKKKKDTVN